MGSSIITACKAELAYRRGLELYGKSREFAEEDSHVAIPSYEQLEAAISVRRSDVGHMVGCRLQPQAVLVPPFSRQALYHGIMKSVGSFPQMLIPRDARQGLLARIARCWQLVSEACLDIEDDALWNGGVPEEGVWTASVVAGVRDLPSPQIEAFSGIGAVVAGLNECEDVGFSPLRELRTWLTLWAVTAGPNYRSDLAFVTVDVLNPRSVEPKGTDQRLACAKTCQFSHSPHIGFAERGTGVSRRIVVLSNNRVRPQIKLVL